MSLAFDSRCLLCQMKRHVATANRLGSEEQAMAFLRDVMQLYASAPEDAPSPWYTPHINQLLNQHYGLPIDRFCQEKLDSNAFVMERMEQLRQRVFSAEDPVLAGVQYAILGNYLEFAALQDQVSFDTLNEMLDSALDMKLDPTVYQAFCRDLGSGRTLLYVTDNAGEIGFDRVCAEAIAAKYPHLKITFCVRGDIANNDATRVDAAAVGVPFPVIDNGNNIPGTQLDMLSEEAEQAFKTADVIFAKGMANVETMLGCGLNVYYAFLIKCERFAEQFKNPMFTPMFVKER